MQKIQDSQESQKFTFHFSLASLLLTTLFVQKLIGPSKQDRDRDFGIVGILATISSRDSLHKSILPGPGQHEVHFVKLIGKLDKVKRCVDILKKFKLRFYVNIIFNIRETFGGELEKTII